jgi:primosomal protein DnaI
MYQIKNTEILLIDDIGAENITSWSRDEVLSPILQYRMDNKLKTFFTSNLSIEDLEKHLALTKDGEEVVKARRIIERIKYLTIEEKLISKNKRN